MNVERNTTYKRNDLSSDGIIELHAQYKDLPLENTGSTFKIEGMANANRFVLSGQVGSAPPVGSSEINSGKLRLYVSGSNLSRNASLPTAMLYKIKDNTIPIAEGGFKLANTGENRPVLISGTAQAGGATTITLAADSEAVDDYYNGLTIRIVAGQSAGESKTITDYVGSTKVATVAAWSAAPDNTSVYTMSGGRGTPGQTNIYTTYVDTNNAYLVEDMSGTFGSDIYKSVSHAGTTTTKLYPYLDPEDVETKNTLFIGGNVSWIGSAYQDYSSMEVLNRFFSSPAGNDARGIPIRKLFIKPSNEDKPEGLWKNVVDNREGSEKFTIYPPYWRWDHIKSLVKYNYEMPVTTIPADEADVEPTPNNTIFSLLRMTPANSTGWEASTDNPSAWCISDMKLSTEKFNTGGQSLKMYHLWNFAEEGSDVSNMNPKDAFFGLQGETNPQFACASADCIPYPIALDHAYSSEYTSVSGAQGSEIMGVVKPEINIDFSIVQMPDAPEWSWYGIPTRSSPKTSSLTTAIAQADTEITGSFSGWPDAGYALISKTSNYDDSEFIAYTTRTDSLLKDCTRSQFGTSAPSSHATSGIVLSSANEYMQMKNYCSGSMATSSTIPVNKYYPSGAASIRSQTFKTLLRNFTVTLSNYEPEEGESLDSFLDRGLSAFYASSGDGQDNIVGGFTVQRALGNTSDTSNASSNKVTAYPLFTRPSHYIASGNGDLKQGGTGGIIKGWEGYAWRGMPLMAELAPSAMNNEDMTYTGPDANRWSKLRSYPKANVFLNGAARLKQEAYTDDLPDEYHEPCVNLSMDEFINAKIVFDIGARNSIDENDTGTWFDTYGGGNSVTALQRVSEAGMAKCYFTKGFSNFDQDTGGGDGTAYNVTADKPPSIPIYFPCLSGSSKGWDWISNPERWPNILTIWLTNYRFHAANETQYTSGSSYAGATERSGLTTGTNDAGVTRAGFGLLDDFPLASAASGSSKAIEAYVDRIELRNFGYEIFNNSTNAGMFTLPIGLKSNTVDSPIDQRSSGLAMPYCNALGDRLYVRTAPTYVTFGFEDPATIPFTNSNNKYSWLMWNGYSQTNWQPDLRYDTYTLQASKSMVSGAVVKTQSTKYASGTATAGGTSTITLAVGSSAVNDYYNGLEISIVGGAADGDVRTISDYVGSTRVATVSSNWSTATDNTSIYNIGTSAKFVNYYGGQTMQVANTTYNSGATGIQDGYKTPVTVQGLTIDMGAPTGNGTETDKLYFTSGALMTALGNDGLSQKGTSYMCIQSGGTYGAWAKRENIFVSARITDIPSFTNVGGQSTEDDIPANTITVDNAGIFEIGDPETGPYYMVWKHSSKAATDAAVTSSSASAGRSQHMTVKEISKNYITFNEDIGDDSDTNLFSLSNLPYLLVGPVKYWITMQVFGGPRGTQTNGTASTQPYKHGTKGGDRTYDNVCLLGSSSAPTESLTGSTWNESIYHYTSILEPTGGRSGVYGKTWVLDAMSGSNIEVDTDFGHDVYDEETRTGGQLAQAVPYLGTMADLDISGLISSGKGLSVGDDFKLVMGLKDPQANQNIEFVNADYSSTDADILKPHLLWGYHNPVPIINNFKVSPLKNVLAGEGGLGGEGLYGLTNEDIRSVKFTWEEQADDVWYRMLMIDVSGNTIRNKYHNAKFVVKGNETPATPTSKPVTYVYDYTATPVTKTSLTAGGTGDSVGADVRSIITGRQGYAIQPNASSTAANGVITIGSGTNTGFDEMGEFTLVMHITPVAADATRSAYLFVYGTDDPGTSDDIYAYIHTDGTVKVVGDANILQSVSKVAYDGETPMSIVYTYNSKATDGKYHKLYIDGVLEDTNTTLINAAGGANAGIVKAGGNITIGGQSTAATNTNYQGLIEEIIIYNKSYEVPDASGEHVFKAANVDATYGNSKDKIINTEEYLTHGAKLFVYDYTNIRGTTTQEVGSSKQIGWKVTSI